MKMKTILEPGDLVRRLRSRMKFDELPRAPLDQLRVEVRGGQAECDWLARRPEVWDSSLWRHRGSELASAHVLNGAIDMNQLFFESSSGAHEAQFRAFWQSAREPPDLIITGKLFREAPSVL
jgi:hypothetical protein